MQCLRCVVCVCCASLYKSVAVLCFHDGIVVVAVVYSSFVCVCVCVYVCLCVCVFCSFLFVVVPVCAYMYLSVLTYIIFACVCIFCVSYIVFICCMPRTTSPKFRSLHFAPEQEHECTRTLWISERSTSIHPFKWIHCMTGRMDSPSLGFL